ncbi:MAG: 30S ribosomal protein S3ae [Candidatus Odinarchaeum yellowstonii]|uniref:Small ribosomal subunit protein eS1 n=1 Tax=Odinarchaeota yellowstonii (strain LCB_4) TaxID=1841599 RepID=A0AAF0D136_ODILC|nr:MAG: 30S ribosomal protein S3ae [Candidatus Odinarchaeum yellowstonii]
MSKSGSSASKDQWAMKEFFTVVSPKYLGNIEIGQTMANSKEAVIGRVVETTLYDITGDISLIHVKIFLQITSVDGNKAYTIFKGHDLTRDYLRSLIRRGTTRIDGRFSVSTKDGYKMIISTIAFTNNRAKTSQEQAVRKIMKDIVYKKAGELNFEQFVQEAVLGKVASEIYNEAKKIVPLRKCEVRKSKLISLPQTPS